MTFRVRQQGGTVVLLVEARSRPGTRHTLIGRPVARLMQLAITKAAIRRLRAGSG